MGTQALGYGGNRVDPLFHGWFCKVLTEEKSSLTLLPRDCTKSTWGIAIKVTQDVIKNPDWSILLATKTAKMSCDRLQVIKGHLENSPLPVAFPEILSPQPMQDAMSKTSRYKTLVWKSDEIKVLRSTQQMELTVETAGIGQFRTGRHYHRMYLDDLIDDDTVLSDVESENALRFEKLLIPMLIEPGGVIRQYGTKWGAGDLYDWVQDRIESEDEEDDNIDWNFVHREVMEEWQTIDKYTPLDQEEYNRRKVYDVSAGCWKAFIYSYFTEEILENKRTFLESEFLFQAQYFNKIVGKDALVFPPPYKETKNFPDDLEYYLTIDPAFKPSKYSDFTALVVCGYNESNRIYVAEAIQLKVDPSSLLDTLYDLYDKYQYKVAGMEDGAWQVVMQWALEHARKESGRAKLPIRGIKVSTAKDAKDSRIRSLSYFFKINMVILREGLRDLTRQLNRYPGNTRSKNDLVDALSMQRQLISWKRNVEKEADIYVRPKETYRKFFGTQQKKMEYVSY